MAVCQCAGRILFCRMEIAPLLRPATADDAAAIRALVRRAYAKWVPLIGREPVPMQADYDRAVADHPFRLAILPDGLVGVIEVIPQPDHLWIENLAVDPAFQGHGLARLLLAEAETIARSLRKPFLRLLTNEAFAGNVSLYQHFGYAITAREAFRGGFTIHLAKSSALP